MYRFLPQRRFTGFLGLLLGMIACSLANFSPAQADPVAFNFNGTVTVSNLPQVSVGDPYTGFIRFDTDIPFPSGIPSSEGTLRASPAGLNTISVDFMNGVVFQNDPSLDFTIVLIDGSFVDAAGFRGSTGAATINATFGVNDGFPFPKGLRSIEERILSGEFGVGGGFVRSRLTIFTPTQEGASILIQGLIEPVDSLVPIAPIPEPSTMLLFGSGLAGLVAWRYRKSRNP